MSWHPPSEPSTPPLTDDEAIRASHRRTRRSFVGFGIAALAGLGGWEWIRTRANVDGIQWPLRKMLRINESVAKSTLFHAGSENTELPPGSAPHKPRVNGDIGLDDKIDVEKWRMTVTGINDQTKSISLADLRAMPKTQKTMRLCCVEGWSIFVNWGGVRMLDFLQHVAPNVAPDSLPPYVAMATPDKQYFVGLDRSSAIHPQTLLAYEIDGQPLTLEHGAPLRLVIPTKYGIKNLKRIGSIDFTNNRPDDYWAKQGYDWFAGL